MLCQLRLDALHLPLPVLLHFVVHAHSRDAINGDEHGLALIATTQEVLHQILSDLLQSILSGDQVVLAGELPLQLALLILVQLRLFQQTLHVGVEVLVGQLQLRDATFVEQRNRCAIVDGLLEVVDADVLAKDGACLLLSDRSEACP